MSGFQLVASALFLSALLSSSDAQTPPSRFKFKPTIHSGKLPLINRPFYKHMHPRVLLQDGSFSQFNPDHPPATTFDEEYGNPENVQWDDHVQHHELDLNNIAQQQTDEDEQSLLSWFKGFFSKPPERTPEQNLIQPGEPTGRKIRPSQQNNGPIDWSSFRPLPHDQPFHHRWHRRSSELDQTEIDRGLDLGEIHAAIELLGTMKEELAKKNNSPSLVAPSRQHSPVLGHQQRGPNGEWTRYVSYDEDRD